LLPKVNAFVGVRFSYLLFRIGRAWRRNLARSGAFPRIKLASQSFANRFLTDTALI